MSWFKSLRSRVRAVFTRGASEARMDEEFAFHLEMERRKLQQTGLSPAEARRRARVVFGGVERYREEMRHQRGAAPLFDLIADVRHAARRLRRWPAFTFTVVTTLALGLGALGGGYSIIYGVLIKPLPYPESARLVMVWQTLRSWPRFPASYPIYERWSRESSSLAALAAYGNSEMIVTDIGVPERVAVSPSTANLDAVLGVPPSRGRWFNDAEDRGGEPVVVISHDYWQTRLGGEPAIGRVLRLDGQSYIVIGVMPPDFRFPSDRTDLWTPLGPAARQQGWNSQSLAVIGRLVPGATVQRAAEEIATITERAVARGESPDVGTRVVLRHEDILGDVRGTLLLVLGTAIVLLVIGLLNVTNLFLARGVAERQDIAIRYALGARGLRLSRELIVEGVLIALAGAGTGLLLGGFIVSSLQAFVPERIPRVTEIAIDLPVTLVVLAVAVTAGVSLGCVSAAAARSQLGLGPHSAPTSRQTAGKFARRLREFMVGAQVAGVFALTSAAALLLLSLDRLLMVERGFDESGLVAVVEPQPLESRYPDAAARDDLFRRVVDRLRAVPAVAGVALVAPLPFSGSERTVTVRPVDGADSITVGVTEVSSNAFEVMGIRLVQGRGFVRRDEEASTDAAVVSERLARLLRSDGNVTGTTLLLSNGTSVQIVGVAEDVRQQTLRDVAPPRVWLPYRGPSGDDVSVVVAAAGHPATLLPDVRAALGDVDPALAAERVTTMSSLLDETAAFPRFRALLLLVLATAGGAVAAVGIFGVSSYAVTERQRELAIRRALGAGAHRVIGDALGREFRVVAVGLGAGLPAAVFIAWLLRGFVFDVGPGDPVIYAVSATAILALSVAASFIPALRAVRTDPLEALREV